MSWKPKKFQIIQDFANDELELPLKDGSICVVPPPSKVIFK